MLVLNRDLKKSVVPLYSYEAIAEEGPQDGSICPYALAMSDLERFANTFDPYLFETETGKELSDKNKFSSCVDRIGENGETDIDFSDLRWALWMQVEESPYPAHNVEKGRFVDRLLDAIHWEVSGTKRQTIGCGPYEPWIGTRGGLIGSGQLRFMVTTGAKFDRDRLFDFVAGLMLRTYGEELIPRSLGMLPPKYRIDDSDLVEHWFMILIQRPDPRLSVESQNGIERAQNEFARAVQRQALVAGLSVEDPSD